MHGIGRVYKISVSLSVRRGRGKQKMQSETNAAGTAGKARDDTSAVKRHASRDAMVTM